MRIIYDSINILGVALVGAGVYGLYGSDAAAIIVGSLVVSLNIFTLLVSGGK